MDIVDTHPHVIADDHAKYPLVPLYGKQSEWSKERSNTTEQYLARLDEAGVAQAALVQASTAHGFDNSYVVDSVKRHPDRFVGVGCVDPVAEDVREKLRYWIKERGLSGVRMYTGGSTSAVTSDWIDKPAAYPYWEEAERLGIPVAVQTRKIGVPMVRNVAQRFPGVKVLLDHLGQAKPNGGPPFPDAQEIFELAQFPNLYLKFSTRNLQESRENGSTTEAFFGKLIELFGANRLMWGSNFPGAWGAGPDGPFKELVDLARTSLSFASEEDQRWMLGETARSVYPALRR